MRIDSSPFQILLHRPVESGQVILAHSPMRALLDQYKDKVVLVSRGPRSLTSYACPEI
jgi:hypothetical protein